MADPPLFISKSYMLPLFTEKADSPVTVNHCMKMIVKATSHLNPGLTRLLGRILEEPVHTLEPSAVGARGDSSYGQTPVMVGDQPLFTLAKRLQWRHPNTDIAEGNFLVMIGAMHEKMLWTVSADWLEHS